MKLAKVVGTVISTIKTSSLEGRRLLLCDYADPDGKFTGTYVIAVDSVGAGVGENVLILDEGSSARQVLEDPDAPIRAVVVGIIDDVSAAGV